MRKQLFGALIMSLALSMSVTAQGNSGKAHGNGHSKGNSHDAQRDDDNGHGHHHGARWEERNGWEYRSYAEGQYPPGWSKGKKTGWGNCDLPPGQAKKYGCNQYRYQGRDYYWYRDDVGRIIVRRPVISVRGGVDIGF
jgi:hypothetical protein